MKATGKGINAPPGLKGFSFQLQQTVLPNPMAQRLSRDGQLSLFAPPGLPIADLQMFPAAEAHERSHMPQPHQCSPAVQIGFQMSDSHCDSSSFLLMAPTADHVAALCVQALNEDNSNGGVSGSLEQPAPTDAMHPSKKRGQIWLRSFWFPSGKSAAAEKELQIIGTSEDARVSLSVI